jgi:hypothetical protein
MSVAAALTALLAACETTPPDRRADAELLTQQIRSRPGVIAASNDLADNPAQGMVYLRVAIEVADDLTGDSNPIHNLRK